MKIAIVGPAHPYKGGIVQQTTELAHRLAAAGHDTELVAWKSQYPLRLYPGVLLPPDQPELPPYPNTSHRLSWNKPWTWRSTGRYLKAFDLVIFVWYVPTFHGVIYRVMLRSLRDIPTAVICHNVLQHDGKPGDRQLAQGFFRRVGRLIVHTQEQAQIAHSLTDKPVSITPLPTYLPGWSAVAAKHAAGMQRQLLFFGIVRDYKGLDVLLRALALISDVRLTIAGEFWPDSHAYERLIDELGLTERVTIQAGYIPAEAIPELFAAADALVLPYKSATGTTNVQLGFGYNLPVIVSDIDTLAEQVRDGENGLIFKANDAADLARAMEQFYQPEVFARLHSHIPPVAIDSVWQKYIEILLDSV